MSAYAKTLLAEIAVVAGVVGALTWAGRRAWPGAGAFALGAAVGAAAHVLFELLGFNARYCRTGAACL